MHKKSLAQSLALALARSQSLALTRGSHSSTIVCNTWMISYIFAPSSTLNEPSELQIKQIRTSKYSLNDAAGLQEHQRLIFENFEKIRKNDIFHDMMVHIFVAFGSITLLCSSR